MSVCQLHASFIAPVTIISIIYLIKIDKNLFHKPLNIIKHSTLDNKHKITTLGSHELCRMKLVNLEKTTDDRKMRTFLHKIHNARKTNIQ